MKERKKDREFFFFFEIFFYITIRFRRISYIVVGWDNILIERKIKKRDNRIKYRLIPITRSIHI